MAHTSVAAIRPSRRRSSGGATTCGRSKRIVSGRRRLQSAGYEVVFESGPVQVLENPTSGNYVQMYAHAVVDLGDDLYLSFDALPEMVWRNMALVAGTEMLTMRLPS